MTACMPWFDIVVAASSAADAGAFRYRDGTIVKSVYFDPSGTAVLSTACQAFTSCFSIYRIKALEFEYCPTGGVTSERAPFIFGWVDDPGHPIGNTPTSAKMENLQTQVQFNAWESWRVKCPINSRNQLYSYDVETTVAAVRNEYAGILMCLQQFASTPSVKYGTLYAHLTIEMEDMSPMFTSITHRQHSPESPPVSRPSMSSATEDDEKTFVITQDYVDRPEQLGSSISLNARRPAQRVV